jgi:hypothetical protein
MSTTGSELVEGPDGKLVRIESVDVGRADMANAAASQQLQNEAAASADRPESATGSDSSVATAIHEPNKPIRSETWPTIDSTLEAPPKMTGPDNIDMKDTGKVEGLEVAEGTDKDASKESSGEQGSGSRPSTAKTTSTTRTLKASQSSAKDQKQKDQSQEEEDRIEPAPDPDRPISPKSRPNYMENPPRPNDIRSGGTGAGDTGPGGTGRGDNGGGGGNGDGGNGGGNGDGNNGGGGRGNVNGPRIEESTSKASTTKNDEENDRLPDDNDIEMTDD